MKRPLDRGKAADLWDKDEAGAVEPDRLAVKSGCPSH